MPGNDDSNNNGVCLMVDEVHCVIAYHRREGDYARDCKVVQTEIANRSPLHQFGEKQTRHDWLEAADVWEQKRKYHRSRARYWKKYLNS